MKIPTKNELLRLTRSALLDLHAAISAYLAALPADSAEQALARAALDDIRALLARSSLAVRRWPSSPPAP